PFGFGWTELLDDDILASIQLVLNNEFAQIAEWAQMIEGADNLRFLVEREDELGKNEYIDDARLIDISLSGFGFGTKERVKVGTDLTISLQFKKLHLDLMGSVVRAFSESIEDDEIIYGVEIDEEKSIKKFLEAYIQSFSSERLKDCLINSALKEGYTKASDGFEMFSLLLSLFNDINRFGDKEGFIENMLEEVVRVMNAQRASIFLINPETNELEAISALGVNKDAIHFDYRLGIAGSVFTTGVALNIDTKHDQTRFNEKFDKMFEFETRSVICHPIHNREDKIIGVIEVINKRNQDRFTVEDEKTMKVLTLIFSSVFHNFNPISEKSKIRRFSTPYDRKYALIGKTPHVGGLRNAIVKTKDIDPPVLIYGEKGVGKSLFATIIHHEGKRGLKPFVDVDCASRDKEAVKNALIGPEESQTKFANCRGGTLYLREVCDLDFEVQKELYKVLVNHGLSEGTMSFDVRVIASTSKDLGEMVENGTFYSKLYEYLNKAFIYMEPLRRRGDDIEGLVDFFLKRECKKQGLLLKSFSPRAIKVIKEYDWPGNIQELRTCIERAVLYNPKAHVITDVAFENQATPLFDTMVKKRQFGDIPHVTDSELTLKNRLALFEREIIKGEIKRHNGNKSKAAKAMGISREALRKKLLYSDSILAELKPEAQNSEKKAA
ncbi:MAG: sigma 54-interacting transcriptional regulator, partial [Bacteriovoracaceae bacterium]